MNKTNKNLLNALIKKDKKYFLEHPECFTKEIQGSTYKGSLIIYFLDENQNIIEEEILSFLDFLFTHGNDELKSEINYGVDKEIYFGAIDYAFRHNQINLTKFKLLFKISEKHNLFHTLKQIRGIMNLIQVNKFDSITYPGTTKEEGKKQPNNYLKAEFLKKQLSKIEAKILKKESKVKIKKEKDLILL